jgi:hypothetical protein
MNEQEFLEGLELLSRNKKKASTASILRKMGYRRGRNILQRELKGIAKREASVNSVLIRTKKPVPEVLAEAKEQHNKRALSSFTANYSDGNVSNEQIHTAKEKSKKDRRVIIRETFPFLNEDNCPDILKILVADMLTSHQRYVRGHDKLFDVAHKDGDTCFRAAESVVESYIENRTIWAELEHYQRTGNLLGEHPLFEIQRKKQFYSVMNEQERSKYIDSLRKKIWKRKELLREDPKNSRVEKWREELKILEAEKKELDKCKKQASKEVVVKKKSTKKTQV